MDTQAVVVTLFLLGLIMILYNFTALHQVLLEIRTEMRLHNSREIRRDLRTLSEQEQERI